MSTYEAIIGLEIHAELMTASKMFCAAPVVDSVEAEPNTAVHPLCLGMPGTLPVINRQAVEYALRVALALNCQINQHNIFARKNYFYPDLPKGYQISQYELPLCLNGYVDIETDDGQSKRIRIRRVHLEEDTGKLVHVNNTSLVDLNRAGVPLVEIVTEADIHSAEEAYAYVSKLRQLVRYLGVSSGDMEKGAMRCEVNLSLQEVATGKWGTKVEVKNLNSFRSVRNAIAYEVERQQKVLAAGGAIQQVTMGWDENRSITVLQRTKEGDTGYRYFPEPDLPPLNLDALWIAQIKANLPELPDAKLARYTTDFGLSVKEALILIEDRAIAEYYESVVAAASAKPVVTPKFISNWVSGELFRLLGEKGLEISGVKIKPAHLVALIELVAANTINQPAAKQTFAVMFDSGRSPQEIVEELGLRQISDTGQISVLVQQVITDNPELVAQFKAGKETIIKFLVGQVMKASRGKANPQLVEQLLREQLQA